MNNMKKGQQYISQISQRFADFICKGVFNLHGYSVRETQTTTTPYSTFCILHSTLFYTFSAKERDSETGLSYFGSRYYSSDLSIWLSVDPQASKYPSLSPYTYCANNPVRLVDPNGEEIYEFDENGKYLGTSGAQGSHDQIAIKKSDGSITISKGYENGTIKLCQEDVVAQEDMTQVGVRALKINDDAQALECFKFVADNSLVEWSLTRTENSSGGNRSNYLSNSQEPKHENSVKLYVNNSKIRIREHWHSQPDGSLQPSTDDYNATEILRNKYGDKFNPNGYIPTYIYSQGKHKQYSPFLRMLEDNINKAWDDWQKERKL